MKNSNFLTTRYWFIIIPIIIVSIVIIMRGFVS